MANPPPRHLQQHLADAGDEWKRVLGEQLLSKPEEISLSEFIRGLPEIITTNDPEGYDLGQLNSWRVEKRMLAPKVQLLMWLLIDMLNDFFAANICFVTLTEHNIMVNRWTCKPRPVGVVPTTGGKTDELMIGQNMASLSRIFTESILARAGTRAPPEVANLLHLMKTKAVRRRMFLNLLHLMKTKAVCPVQNRGAYFVCMHDIAWDGMRQVNGLLGNGDGYKFVINNLNFDSDWDVLVKENMYLEMYYEKGGGYMAQGDPTTNLAAEQEVVMRFHRDVAVNWIEGVALDDAAPYGLKLRKEQTALMLYSALPRVTVSMAESLDVVGYLCVAGMEPLFPGRLLKPMQS
ncbi:hypothetical protein QOZ80_9BG0693970 [Eleusine coracana subsp. coracana]|nr:hypothetical protein QOZ80_9BG0693970 [Eleusine coracana subsp. coracana]